MELKRNGGTFILLQMVRLSEAIFQQFNLYSKVHLLTCKQYRN